MMEEEQAAAAASPKAADSQPKGEMIGEAVGDEAGTHKKGEISTTDKGNMFQ